MATKDKSASNALEAALESVKKDYGSGSIFLLSDSYREKNLEVISTGLISLDRATGVGGFPCGKFIEIFGEESSGKTTLALTVVAQAQKLDHKVLYIDSEHSLDPVWAQKLGVQLDKTYISQPSCTEEAIDIIERIARIKGAKVIVVDSVAALIPKAEVEGVAGELHVGLQARLMSQACRKLAKPIQENGIILIWINQFRSKIGVLYGDPRVTTGGNALKFYAGLRLEVASSTPIKEGNSIIGSTIRVKVKKNKVAKPFEVCEIPLIHNIGFSAIYEVIDELTNLGFIKRSGPWYYLNEEKIGSGKASVYEFFSSNPEKLEEMKNLIGKQGVVSDHEE